MGNQLTGFVAALTLAAAATLGARAEVTGKAVFLGNAPSVKRVGAVVVEERIAVGPNDGLQNVVVYVKDGAKLGGKVPQQSAALVIKGDRYVPHVVAAMVGQALRVGSVDAKLHDVVSLPKANKACDIPLQGAGAAAVPGATERVETYRVRCGVHPWMEAWVVVLDHPFFAVTGADGQFEIPGLPPGKHTLVAWHEWLREQEAEVEVGKDGKVVKAVEFKFEPKRREGR